jgi:hypothetical protein
MSRRLRIRMLGCCLAIGGIFAVAMPALADKIDGEWCHASQSLQIEGPSIRTPGGSNIKGNYTRHNFSFVVPTPEPEAGAEIDIRLLSEEAMVLTRRNGGRPEETWQRCRVTS